MKKLVNDNPETFWAWLAGFIDGDGSISLYQGPHGQPQWKMQVSQKGREILDVIVARAGIGSVHVLRMDGETTYWHLVFGSAATRALCKRLLPYLEDAGKKQRAGAACSWTRLGPGEYTNSPEKNADFAMAVELYQDGASAAEVAIRFGISQQTALRWADRAGVKRPISEAIRLRGLAQRGKTKNTKYAKKRIEALRLAEAGESGLKISAALGVPPSTVYFWIRSAQQRE